MNVLLQDLRYALRGLLKVRSSLVAVLTLAVGIGASVAVFSVVDCILLKQLPYPNADRVVIPWRLVPPGKNLGYEEIPWGVRDVNLFSGQSRIFEAVGAFQNDQFTLTGLRDPDLLDGLRASYGFFKALGTRPLLGRLFTQSEDHPGSEHEVLLSYELWQTKLGADAGIVGRSIDLNGTPYVVVGVMPADFTFPRANDMPGSFEFPKQAQLWVPLALPSTPPAADASDDLAVIALLRPGATTTQAQAEMNLFSHQEDTEHPRAKGWFSARVMPLKRQVLGQTRTPLLLILATVCVVLLVSCSNVGNLQLAQAIGRHKEFTLRAALGASPLRIIQQLMTESLILAALGGLLGLCIAFLSIVFIRNYFPDSIPRIHEVSLDKEVLLFAFAVTLISGLLFGLVPALATSRIDLVSSLKEGGSRSGTSRSHRGLRNSLLIIQIALSLVLVVAAGMLVRSFAHLLDVNPGFQAEKVLTFQLPLPASRYSTPNQIVGFYNVLLPKLRSIAGVHLAAIAETAPMGGAGESTVIRFLDGRNPSELHQPLAGYMVISPSFFATIGTPILRGREFTVDDDARSIPVTIINESMAKTYWPQDNPIGKRLGLGSIRYPPMTIIGVVADIKQLSLRDPAGPEMYVPFTQNPWPSMLNMEVMLRTDALATAATSVPPIIHSMDAAVPVAKLVSLQALVDESLVQTRFSMLLMVVFGSLAVILASIGMYGVLSYATAQRTQEIGIRMALGANRTDIFKLIVIHGVRLAIIGIGIGLIGALLISRTMKNVLYNVSTIDPLTFSAASLLFVVIALIACYRPARRATRVQPSVALKME